MQLRILGAVSVVVLATASSAIHAGGVPGKVTQLDAVTVTAEGLLGEPDSASVGTATAEQLENRPISRPGEILEVVPGLIVTQHSGEGKANQYFLRGYNLDHGNDFATTVDGLPVNLPTHAHGQGYSDLNFMIPELVDSIEYRKGPYYAQYGDFSEAGAADIRYKERFEHSLVEGTAGTYGYGRGLFASSLRLVQGDLLIGAEYIHYDGPYDLGENFNKGNLVLRYSHRDDSGSWHLTAMGYSSRNNSPDQIPQRAVDQGIIGSLGDLDPTDGGRSNRYSLSGGLDLALGPGRISFAAYAFHYGLDLFSDFTYFLDDPVNGDQFEQYDERNVYGGSLDYALPLTFGALRFDNEFGVQTRYDDIEQVALYSTHRRQRLGTTSDSRVNETSVAVYGQTGFRLTPWARATLGLRYDDFHFAVASDTPANSGNASDSLLSPKVALILGPFEKTEFFVDYGQGFHSNDARGAVQRVDPKGGDAVDPVTPLVVARGIDLGLRTAIVPKMQVSFSLFTLSSDSELVFSGDSGTTQPNPATRRYGGELSTYYTPIRHLIVDADIAYTRARFREDSGFGRDVPEAVQGVAGLGATYASPQGWDIGFKFRYFGPRPLIENDSVKSQSTTIVNLGAGYKLTRHLKLDGEILNLFDSADHDIDYFYTSRRQGEPAQGVDDTHFHRIEPINGRVSLRYEF